MRKPKITGPKLLAFPTGTTTCRVWCPNCARWHSHGVPAGEATARGGR